MQPSQSVFLGFIYLCVLSVSPPPPATMQCPMRPEEGIGSWNNKWLWATWKVLELYVDLLEEQHGLETVETVLANFFSFCLPSLLPSSPSFLSAFMRHCLCMHPRLASASPVPVTTLLLPCHSVRWFHCAFLCCGVDGFMVENGKVLLKS